MKAVTRDQSHEIVGRVLRNTNWGAIDGDQLQSAEGAIGMPETEFGRRLTLFIQNGMNFVMKGPGALIVDRTKPFNAEFIGSDWTIWLGAKDGDGLKGKEAQDPASLALTEIDFAKVLFTTCLNEGETSITGEEKLARHFAAGHIRLDVKIGQCLYKEKGQATLEWLYQTFGITWFELPGTELRRSNGSRYVLYLGRDGDGRWRWGCSWLELDRHAGNPSAVLASGA